jgi:hypothetical protein
MDQGATVRARMRRVCRRGGLASLGVLLQLWCAACGGSSNSSPAAMPQALVAGAASGPVLQTIGTQYRLVAGSGSEDPGPYAMIIFDGNNTTPAQLQANPGVANFLAAGKAVVILNNTEDHRSAGLKGAVWAHAEGSSPAAGWIYFFNKTGHNIRILGTKELEQIDFPQRIIAPLPGETPTAVTPDAAQLQHDSEQWLGALQRGMAGGGSDIGPSSCSAANAADCSNQTVLSFHDLQSLNITVPLIINSQDNLPPDFTTWGPDNSQPPSSSPASRIQINATFETRGYALLEGNANSGYFHKIIVRQYLDVSPPPAPVGQSWTSVYTQQITDQQPIAGSCDSWNYLWPVYATLGWNDAVTLDAQLEDLPGAVSLGIRSFLPKVANNVTTLTTSNSHTETVGVSATAGIQNETGVGTLSASWSESWTWGQAQTISIADWQVSDSSIGSNNTEATYAYDASGNSDITDSVLTSHALILPLDSNPASNNQLNNPNYCDLRYVTFNGVVIPPGLNGLQTNALATQSETVWEVNTNAQGNGLIPPQTIKLVSSGTITSGEVLDLVGGDGPFPNCNFVQPCPGLVGFTAAITTPLQERFDLDFSNPALQPPGWDTSTQQSVPAPWTLSFPLWPNEISLNQPLTGTVTIPQDALTALSATSQNLLLTYVVGTQSALQTLPAEQACPGNEFTFNPGNNAVSNGKPPLQIPWSAFTCSSGTCSAPVSLTFQTSQTNQYDVQVVAWLPRMVALNGDTVLGPQSAWCLDVPETTIQ